MYFISYLTDVLTVTNFLHHPQTFNSAKLKNLNKFSKASRDNFAFEGNLSYFSLSLTNNLPITNLQYPQTFKWTRCLTLNMFSEPPRVQIKKARKIFALWFDMNWHGFAVFLHTDVVWWIEVL